MTLTETVKCQNLSSATIPDVDLPVDTDFDVFDLKNSQVKPTHFNITYAYHINSIEF